MKLISNTDAVKAYNSIYANQEIAAHYASRGASAVQDRQEANSFLQMLDPDAKFFTFQTFDDDKDRKDTRLSRVLHGSLEEHWDELVDLECKRCRYLYHRE